MWIPRMLIVLVVVAGAIAGVSAELSDEYSIDIDGSMDIPDQTIETEFGEATISEVGKEEAGNVLGVSTDAPENESYVLRVLDAERTNLDSERLEGNAETDFFLDRYDPGTYAVVITKDGGREAKGIEPFIVKGYSVEQQVSDVTKGSNLTVNVELTEVNSRVDSPQAVNVTLTGNDEVRSIKAQKTDNLQYNATFETDSLSTGEYEIYSGVESGGSIFGYDELVGLSSAQSFEITSQEGTPTSTSTATPTSTSITTETEESGGVGGSGTDQATESATTTTATIATSAAQSTESAQSSPSSEDPESARSEDTEEAASAMDSPVEDSESSNQADQENMTRTEAVETTATGTPVVPNLVICIFILTAMLAAQRFRN